jgi:hypothetical protein
VPWDERDQQVCFELRLRLQTVLWPSGSFSMGVKPRHHVIVAYRGHKELR